MEWYSYLLRTGIQSFEWCCLRI